MDITMVMPQMPAVSADTGQAMAAAMEGDTPEFGALLAELQGAGQAGEGDAPKAEAPEAEAAPPPAEDSDTAVDEGQDLAQQLAGMLVQQAIVQPQITPPETEPEALVLELTPEVEAPEMPLDPQDEAEGWLIQGELPPEELPVTLAEAVANLQKAESPQERAPIASVANDTQEAVANDTQEAVANDSREAVADDVRAVEIIPTGDGEKVEAKVDAGTEGANPQAGAKPATAAQTPGKAPAKAPVAVQSTGTRQAEAEETLQPTAQQVTEAAFVPRQAAAQSLFEPQPLDTEQPDFPEALAQTVVQKAESGVKQFDIALYPKELGKVTVSVQLTEGQAVLSFVCENAKSQNILNAHAAAITSLVEQSTGRQTVAEVPQDSNQQHAGQESYDGHNGENQGRQQSNPQRPQREQVGFFIDQLKSSMLVG